jgi:hypothetical protein
MHKVVTRVIVHARMLVDTQVWLLGSCGRVVVCIMQLFSLIWRYNVWNARGRILQSPSLDMTNPAPCMHVGCGFSPGFAGRLLFLNARISSHPIDHPYWVIDALTGSLPASFFRLAHFKRLLPSMTRLCHTAILGNQIRAHTSRRPCFFAFSFSFVFGNRTQDSCASFRAKLAAELLRRLGYGCANGWGNILGSSVSLLS